MYQAIRGGLAGSTVLDAKAPMVMDRNFKPGFRIDLHIKDLANALDTSHGVGAQLPLTAAVMEMMQALRADGLGAISINAVLPSPEIPQLAFTVSPSGPVTQA